MFSLKRPNVLVDGKIRDGLLRILGSEACGELGVDLGLADVDQMSFGSCGSIKRRPASEALK
jgi:hypothetical protein